MTALDFVPVWTLILGAGIFFYVLLDGFDLGVGMLYGFMRDAQSRNTVMSAIAPVWDGNETWLVEFRFRDAEHRTFWDHGFFYGSVVATVAQGVMLGAFIQGFRVEGRVFAGTVFDFLTPFSILTGIALVSGYALLGAGWLVLKTEGEIQERARRYGSLALAGVLVALLLVSIWTPLMSEQISRRWFSWPNILLLSPVPIATTLVAFGTWRALSGTSQSGAFIGAIGLFALSYAGIAISLWPMIVPNHYTLWQAASSPSTQAFLMVGTLFLLPVILVYTGWSYWVFRGKVHADVAYH